LIEALRSFVNARHDNWDEFLTHFEFAYNSTVNASTGFSPFILQFAQAPRAPWDSVLDQGGDEKRKMSGKDIAMSLGFDTLSNLKRARDSLHAIAQKQRVQNALRSAPHAYAVDEEVLLSTENISLKGATRKLGPKYVGPFKITEVLGKNAVRIVPTGRFSAIHDVINVEYLRPYRLRSKNVGPPPHHLSIKPIAVEPEGEWFNIAEILHHRGRPGPSQQFLVRWDGFDSSHDSWVARKDITPKALEAYELFLRGLVTAASTPKERARRHKELSLFLGKNEQYSAFREQRQAAHGGAARTPRGERESDSDGDHPAEASVSLPAASDSAPSRSGRLRRPPQYYGKR
jgi:hypothetical protein